MPWALIPQPSEPMLVINGDVLTQVNFRAFLAFHQENRSDMTVAVRRYEFEVPYGVVDCEGVRVRGLREKPRMDFFVNAGIYLLEPVVFQYIPKGKFFNMTDLIQRLLDVNRIVVGFPVREYWLDIGQHAEYAKAQEDVLNGLVGSSRRKVSSTFKKESKKEIMKGNRLDWHGKKVLVTGAGGFIGSHLAERLVELGADVRALIDYNALGNWGWLDRSPLAKEVEVMAGDISDRDSVRTVVQGREYVFHLAALIGIPYSYHAPDRMCVSTSWVP